MTGDYISRTEAIKILKNCGAIGGFGEFLLREKVPSADVVPAKPGRWSWDEYAYAHCTKCGYEMDEPETTTNFCPGCGAKMDGGKS